MPFNCLGLLVGDTDADSAVGPAPIVINALLTESGAFLKTEDGAFLQFELKIYEKWPIKKLQH